MQMLHFSLHHKIVQNEDLARGGPTGKLETVELGSRTWAADPTCDSTFCLTEREDTAQSLQSNVGVEDA